MRIAYFTESLPPNTDGVSHTLVKLDHFLNKKEHEHCFISPFKPSSPEPLSDLVKQTRFLHFPLYPKYRISLPMISGIYTYLDDFEPDLVHVMSLTPLCIFGIFYAKRKKIPVVGSYHTHFVAYFKYYNIGFLEGLGWHYLRWFYSRCSQVYVPSRSIMYELRQHGVRKVVHLPHGIDVQCFAPKYRSKQLRAKLSPAGQPLLLYVGRLVKEKDLDDLVAAYQILYKQGFRFKLAFAGEGPMRDGLAQQLPDSHFTGMITGKRLSQWYASADLFVFPSTTETFGLVVQEAFASGLPVVSVRRGGVKSLIRPGQNGLLAAPNDPADLAAKVQYLLERPQLRSQMGKRARQLVLTYSWKNVYSRLLQNYHTLLSA